MDSNNCSNTSHNSGSSSFMARFYIGCSKARARLDRKIPKLVKAWARSAREIHGSYHHYHIQRLFGLITIELVMAGQRSVPDYCRAFLLDKNLALSCELLRAPQYLPLHLSRELKSQVLSRNALWTLCRGNLLLLVSKILWYVTLKLWNSC